ncbi:hypothetical protein [Bordetella avium]|nr:hypothetical protein [Bordetella avium]UOK17060.1 hypothetical protein vBBaMIFTN1_58 [Bordetella phage vB_BaM-IFTN1]UOK17187.1 hypothetical protein vBBaMIFTN3_58 [Bordetella phage vB_BaM-IFTN3]UOK17253.1 hypothetical protein vBBaMIFTN4_61 [Bordetella phage vB_BaM-IFTN4]UOK17327.1 hypothetical protein vBBaMIFTN5_63 [Bordetella phage vB_BaM-IFTN5]UOK17459.1 hypothetical protein vBBaMIFTN7_62 [Bordetella phage vB_BaM-IFTN7]UOK17599.1 hypothetical protein vBBaMIFTN9_58 [Bordetella phage vB_BaM
MRLGVVLDLHDDDFRPEAVDDDSISWGGKLKEGPADASLTADIVLHRGVVLKNLFGTTKGATFNAVLAATQGQTDGN